MCSQSTVGISVREFARRLGVRHRAVQVAIERGRLSRSIVRIDGVPRVADPELAVREWTANASRLPVQTGARTVRTGADLRTRVRS